MKKYNLDKLVKAECYGFRKSFWYTVKKEKKAWLGVFQEAGIYSFPSGFYLGWDIPKYHTLEDGFVCEKPKVILHYQGGFSRTYHFEKASEATIFYHEITKTGNWIE